MAIAEKELVVKARGAGGDPPAAGTIQLTLDLSPELNILLENTATQTGVSKEDVLRKGIILMGVAVKAKQAGMKFGVIDDNQRIVTEIVDI